MLILELWPCRHFYSEKHRTGMTQGQYGSQCMHDFLKIYAVALSGEHDFQLGMH